MAKRKLKLVRKKKKPTINPRVKRMLRGIKTFIA